MKRAVIHGPRKTILISGLKIGKQLRGSIYGQMAQGSWVATMFDRKMTYQGKDVEVEAMQFKRFEDGKIAEIWEFYDTKQIE